MVRIHHIPPHLIFDPLSPRGCRTFSSLWLQDFLLSPVAAGHSPLPMAARRSPLPGGNRTFSSPWWQQDLLLSPAPPQGEAYCRCGETRRVRLPRARGKEKSLYRAWGREETLLFPPCTWQPDPPRFSTTAVGLSLGWCLVRHLSSREELGVRHSSLQRASM